MGTAEPVGAWPPENPARQNVVALVDISPSFKVAIGGRIPQPLVMPPEWRRRFEAAGYVLSPEEDAQVTEALAGACRDVFTETYGRPPR